MNWLDSNVFVDGLDSEGDRRWRIAPLPSGAVVLIDFASEDRGGRFWTERFDSVALAQKCAEQREEK